jgi:hypothetical protein
MDKRQYKKFFIMEDRKKLVFYITKIKDFNGNVRFHIKAVLSGLSKEVRTKREELWENAWVINNPKDSKKRQEGQEKLRGQFWVFLKKILEEFELDKTYNDRAEFEMKFGDEYSTRCSVGIGARPEHWDQSKYKLIGAQITVPVNQKEIEFFWQCIYKPILI